MTEETAKQPSVDQKSDEPTPTKGLSPAVLKGEIKIFPDKRLPYLDQGAVKAYEAVGNNGVKAFAMVCEKRIVPQVELVHKYTSITTPHLPKLIGCGVVDWPADFSEHFVFVYEDKMGKPIVANKNPAAMGLKGDVVVATILRNLLDAIHAARDNGFVHGNIRVQNIFDGGSSTFESAMLGETLSIPTGYAQPVIYETVSRSLASPLGRGAADYTDDIYALGITVAALMRVHDIAEGMSDEEIIHQKIELGSFNFITGKDRFPAQILEFLRGTLNDDPQLRWNFEDIMTWADGRRVSAKQGVSLTALKASRPLEFQRKKFLRPQALSVALPLDSSIVVPLVENGELYLWLNRSLQNKEYEVRYEQALNEAQKSSANSNFADRLASAMAIAMAPENPIFYRDLKFLPSGFSSLLIDSIQTKKDINPFVDVIQGSLVSFWSKCTKVQVDGVIESANRIENCQRFMSQSAVGYGLERCVYYLSPMAPCFSDKLSAFYVRTAEDYLNALEKLSSSKQKPEWFLDRHIIAFLSVRDKSIIEPFLADISASEKHRQKLGVLKVLASIQRRDKMQALPGVSAWIGGMLEDLIARFHDREYRKKVKDQLDKIKDKGSLEKIAALFDNYEQIQMDMQNYTVAMRQYQALKVEFLQLGNELDTNPNFGAGAGRQVSTLVSGAIAALVVIVYLIYSVSSGGVRIF